MSADPVEQARQCMKNIEGALAAVGASAADVDRSRVVIPNTADVPSVMAYVGEKFCNIDPCSTVTYPRSAAPTIVSRST